MKPKKIEKEIEDLKNKILKLRELKPKTDYEVRNIAQTIRDLSSKIVSLSEKKRYGR